MGTGRVPTRTEFSALHERGVRSRRHSVRVIYLPAGPGNAAAEVAVAFAIGRPVGSAVVRNRLRRRLRAAFGELGPQPGTYLLTASPSAATHDFARLRHELSLAIEEVGAR